MYIIVCHYLYCKYTPDLSGTSTDLIWMYLVLAKLVHEHPHCSNDNHLCLQTEIPTGTAIYVDLALECLGNHNQVFSISLTWGDLGNVWWQAMTNFPLPSRSSWESFESANMFSWQFPWCKFLSFMCSNQCQYEHSWTSCSCLYLQSYCSHEQIEGLKNTEDQRALQLCWSHQWLSHAHSFPFSCGCSGVTMKNTCRPL